MLIKNLLYYFVYISPYKSKKKKRALTQKTFERYVTKKEYLIYEELWIIVKNTNNSTEK